MKYYKTDSRKISFLEYYNISPRGFLLTWVWKILRVSIPLAKGIPEPTPFQDNLIESHEIPPVILAKLNTGIAEFRQIGFKEFWFYRIKGSLIGGNSFGVEALHSGERITGKIIFTSLQSRQTFIYVLNSELCEGTILGTTNYKPQFKSPPNFMVLRKIGATAAELLQLHQLKLVELENTTPAKTITSFAQVALFEEKIARMSFDDKTSRGVWVEMTDTEVEALRAQRASTH